jgi:hypothetical protein
MTTYHVYFTDGSSCSVEAACSSDARYLAQNRYPGKIVERVC